MNYVLTTAVASLNKFKVAQHLLIYGQTRTPGDRQTTHNLT
jgi:hypothetical protein